MTKYNWILSIYSLLHFVAFFHVASLFSKGVDNKKDGVDNENALELTNSTVFHRGRQWKSSRAGQQNNFFTFQPDFNIENHPKMQQNILLHSSMIIDHAWHSGLNLIFCCRKSVLNRVWFRPLSNKLQTLECLRGEIIPYIKSGKCWDPFPPICLTYFLSNMIWILDNM